MTLLVRQAAVAVLLQGPVAAPLLGDWSLNLARTHYGPGVDRRREERFTCRQGARGVACEIRSVREDGRRVEGRFTAPSNGTTAPVTGIAGIDRVALRAVVGGVVEVTFSGGGAPRFGYRAYRSADGRSLMVVSIEPGSARALTTVVVYDAR
jgi:hypothetical protein